MTTCVENVTKKSKRTMKIGTHSGGFHCDELLACFLLTRLPRYKDADIIRYLVHHIVISSSSSLAFNDI